jgi:hypothetical protein
MNEYIANVVDAYVQNLITQDEMCTAIAKEYVKLSERGRLLAALGINE